MATFREINRGDGSGTTLYYRMDVTDTLDLSSLGIDKETILYKTGLEMSEMSSEPAAVILCTEDYTYTDKQGNVVSVVAGNIYQMINGIIVNTYGDLLTSGNQLIDGKKTFSVIPEVNSYVAPTLNTQLVAKKYVDDKISSVYRYKGTVLTYNDLPDTDLTVGDVYNIETADPTHAIKAGDNVAWTGTEWDVLSGLVDISTVPTVIAATNADPLNLSTAKPGLYLSTNSADFYYKFTNSGAYHTNRPFTFFVLLKNIEDALYGELFGYGLYFEKQNGQDGYCGLARFSKHNDTYANISYVGIVQCVTNQQQYFSGEKIFTSYPRLNSYNGDPTDIKQFTPKKYVDDNIAKYDTMPTADNTTINKIVQYIGTTDNTYTSGYFYIGTTDNGDPATYSWEQLNVQPNSSIEFDSFKFGGLSDSDKNNAFIMDGHNPGIYLPGSKPTYLKWYLRASANHSVSQALTETTYQPVMMFYLRNYSEAEVGDVLAIVVTTSTGTVKEAVNIRSIVKSNNVYGIEYGNVGYNLGGMLMSADSYTTQRLYGPKIFNALISTDDTTTALTSDGQYTHKKYVDTQINNAIGNINTVLATLTTPSNGGGN